jgi:hypothetical protein
MNIRAQVPKGKKRRREGGRSGQKKNSSKEKQRPVKADIYKKRIIKNTFRRKGSLQLLGSLRCMCGRFRTHVQSLRLLLKVHLNLMEMTV